MAKGKHSGHGAEKHHQLDAHQAEYHGGDVKDYTGHGGKDVSDGKSKSHYAEEMTDSRKIAGPKDEED